MTFIALGSGVLALLLATTAWMGLRSRSDPGRTYRVRRSWAGPRHEVTFAWWVRHDLPQALGWAVAMIAVGLLLRR